MAKRKNVEAFERQVFPAEYFEKAKSEFRKAYEEMHPSLVSAEDAFRNLVLLLLSDQEFPEPKVVSRIKKRSECVSKFDRKYRSECENLGDEYQILEHITDLIGIRVICLYEDDIEKIEARLREEFEIIDKTDKSKEVEETISSFGYKGLHLDLALTERRKSLPEYEKFSDYRFEVQIRTIVQDGWSEIDHKIKYKKETPEFIQRRVACLAALFEMADREFQTIRDLSRDLERQVEEGTVVVKEKSELDLVGFLSAAGNYFPGFQMGGLALELLMKDIRQAKQRTTTEQFRMALSDNLETVQDYAEYMLGQGHDMAPYTQIRHALYRHKPANYSNMLFEGHRRNFDRWCLHGTVHPAEITS